MNRKVLFVATVASAIDNFNRDNIRTLQDMGYQVSIAANFSEENSNSQNQIQSFIDDMTVQNVACFQIDFTRKIAAISRHINSYRKLCSILADSISPLNGVSHSGRFSFIHCHTPIGAAISRLAAHKMQVKCVYTAHGFHFYDGAPLRNWIFYYPVEWLLSYLTDVLITINKEDYHRACNRFHAKKTIYVPGVGVNVLQFVPCSDIERKRLREGYHLNPNDVLLISVGELCTNKNQGKIIETIKRMSQKDRKNLKYFICGMGVNEAEYQKLIEKYQLQDTVKLLGYRTDVSLLYQIADITVFPSIREGLPLAVMEAMSSGLPIIGSNIRGVADLIVPSHGGYLVEPHDINKWTQNILYLKYHSEKRKEFGEYNRCMIQNYSEQIIQQQMKKIYERFNN